MNQMTTKEVAELLGVSSPATVKNWLEGGSFPGAVFVNGEWMFSRVDAEAVKAHLDQYRGHGGFEDEEEPTAEPPLL